MMERNCENCKYNNGETEKEAFEEPCCYCGIKGNYFEPYKSTYYEQLKNNTIDEMADFLYRIITCCVPDCKDCVFGEGCLCRSPEGIKQWLESEVTEG